MHAPATTTPSISTNNMTANMTGTGPMNTTVRPGLYHVRLTGQRGYYERSEGIILQFKKAYGYFTLPGPDRTCVAFAVGSVAGDSSVEVQVDPRVIGGAEDAEPLLRRANRMPRQKAGDSFWSDVARLRNAGLPYAHLFGRVTDVREVMEGRRCVFRPTHLDCNVELELLEIVRPRRFEAAQ